ERRLASLIAQSEAQAYEQLQRAVREDANVHRVVLSWRAFDLQRFAGDQNALTLLRQSVRFCIDEDHRRAADERAANPMAALVPKLLADHGLDAPGSKRSAERRPAADDALRQRWGEELFAADSAHAAEAVATLLADGVDPEDVGAALSLAATRLLLHD